MSGLRKAAQDVVDAKDFGYTTQNNLNHRIEALRAAMQQPDDAKQRLLEIMRRNGLATGHGDTLKQVIDTLEVELTDVLSAARQNAARYRWLRDVSDTEFMEELSDTFFGEWDAVIDAAMQQPAPDSRPDCCDPHVTDGSPCPCSPYRDSDDPAVVIHNDFDEWKPYLKDGETPFERFIREHKDLDALLELYKKEKNNGTL